ncbi:unnamed protein product [Rangifer tarandus platyrhynchus]|uniref:Uncharacterized protein n=1 Tax=Rangifer tarandus platyrhynchus TaxID=3082113 RepID=A0AC60AAN1_RANTA
MGCNLVQFRTADSTGFRAARDACAQVPEFRGTLGNTWLFPSRLDPGTLHLQDRQSSRRLCRASGDEEPAQITVWKWNHGKITNKSIEETGGSLIHTFNDSPQRLKKHVTSPKTYTSKEHSHALKLGHDSGRSLNFRAKKH